MRNPHLQPGTTEGVYNDDLVLSRKPTFSGFVEKHSNDGISGFSPN